MSRKKKKKNNNVSEVINSTTAFTNSDTVGLYSNVQGEYVKSYTGYDSSTGKTLTKSLKSISQQKINPDYAKQNLRQNAGFVAEVKSVARQNEEAILSGKKTRVIRTDDIGRVNEQYADTTVVDSHGNEISGTQTQIKFVGETANDTHSKLMSKKFDKYFNNPDKVQKIEVPSDRYDDVMQISKNKISDYQKQLKSPKVKNNPKLSQSIKDKIHKEQQLQGMLKKSPVSTDEAISAVKNPFLSTAKDVVRVSHNAGVTMAKGSAQAGAIMHGGMALYQVMTGQISAKEGLNQFAIGTAKVAANGYVVGATASLLATALKESSYTVLKSLGNSNLPAVIVSNVVAVSGTLYDFINGDITAGEFAKRLGETGVSTLTGTAYAAVGQALIPIPVVGATVGALVGTILGSACYKSLKVTLEEEKLAIERRKAIEKQCDAYDEWLDEQRRILNAISEDYLIEHKEVFNSAISDIRRGLISYNSKQVIGGANKITQQLGGKVQFNDLKEFEGFMESDEDFIL